MNQQDIYRCLYTIRVFEETVLENFHQGIFSGTTHAYLGQEANAAGVLAHIQPGDIVFSNHRCHGHFLAYGGEPRALFAEMMGKPSGVCAGRGGSQHLQWRNFYSNGVQGGIVPVATGMALAEKFKSSSALVVCFLGDGTLGEGVIYESFNLASLYGVPVLYVLEDNGIAQTTPVEQAVAGEMRARFTAFGIPVRELDTADVDLIYQAAGELMAEVRHQQQARALILHTCRFGPHSKGDDTRPSDLVARLQAERDPLTIQAARFDPVVRQQIETQVEEHISQALAEALAAPAYTKASSLVLEQPEKPFNISEHQAVPAETGTVLASLNAGLQTALRSNEQVVLLGEDLLDPYGGAFKVARSLSSQFPARVISTPISEAGITGLAAGLALRGMRPVIEIMFGDFITLAADQLINHIAKFRWMYNDQVRVPLVLRTPMGGGRGYGPTHSQSLEKLFMGVPGLRLVAPTALGDPGGLLAALIQQAEDPILFIENKLLYLSPVLSRDRLPDFELQVGRDAAGLPWYGLTIAGAPGADLTIVAYGYMAELARQAAQQLAYEWEIFAEVIVPTQIAPMDLDPLVASLQRTRRLLVLEEGSLRSGWGAELLAGCLEALGDQLRAARRVAALDLPIPAAVPLEQAVLPGLDEIVSAARQLI